MLRDVRVRRGLRAVWSEAQHRPARGRGLLVRHIRCRRRVENVDSLVLEEVAVMNVAVDVGFDVFSLGDGLPEWFRVFEAAGEVYRITPEAWIVMGEEKRGLVRMLIEQFRQPFHLRIANESLRDHRGFQ